MANFNSASVSVSTATQAAPSIVVCYGTNEFGSFHVEVTERGYLRGGFDTTIHTEWVDETGCSLLWNSLVELIEADPSVWALMPYSKSGDKTMVEGDIAYPEAKVWDYSRDVVKLAKTKKREEVINSTETLYGIELEFNHSSHSLMELSPLLGMGIFKSDCSVDGEYVTLPYTYEEMVAKVKKLSEAFDKLLSANRTLTETSGVGMHVHVTRRALSDNVWVSLVHWICQHRTEVETLAGRKANKWCKYQYGGSDDRYVAVNLCNTNTVEFRMFLSPHDADGVLRNLSTVKRWVDLAQSLPPNYDHLVEHRGYEIAVVGDAFEAGYAVAERLPYFMQRDGFATSHMVVSRNVGKWAAPVRLPYHIAEDGSLVVDTRNYRSNIRAGRIEEALYGWADALEIELHSPQGWEAFEDYDPDSEPGANDYGDMDGDEDDRPTSEWLFY